MAEKLTTAKFIERATKAHNGYYDYSKVDYINTKTKVCIICPEHGEFWQCPEPHYNRKQGCPICRYIKSKQSIRKKQGLTTSIFINKAIKIHGNKYNYSKVQYENTDTKVCIICPEHGEFWQTPHHHLNGSGCPECGRNDLSEKKITDIIRYNFEHVITQYKPDFLKKNGKSQSIDIFLPDYNIGIEYQGRQHFEPISRFGGKEEFEKTKERDQRKYDLCKNNNITILYFSYEHRIPQNYISKIFTQENEIIQTIKQYINDNRL